LVFICGFSAIASHIVGAELFYDYLGGNNYKITLRLYRNCDPACTQCAPYGDPEYVQIFDSLGNYIDSIPMALPNVDTVPSLITNPCLTPIDVYICQAYYTGNYNLPPRPGGYTLVYQRCCRNSAIQSIPTNTGASYVAHISNDRFPVNSSPRFSQRPPKFICANSYLQFDNSATDPDGDSLSYSLVNALDGASSACPNPSPGGGGLGCNTWASTPPYTPVPYFTPYGATNPTNNPVNTGDLQIDPVTGLLTGIPDQTGIFVVAVAVSEYRHGQYIGQTVRDYQFNIVQCNIPTVNLIYLPGTYNNVTNYGIYQLDCTTRTVDFNQVSFYNPPPTNVPLTYSWNFGVPGSATDTSSQEFPVFTYPDTGTYFVTVVVSKTINGQGCVDTAHALVITYPTLFAGFTYQSGCQDSAVVFTDASISTSSPLNSWSWNFGDGQSANTQNTTHHYAAPGTYIVSLTAGNTKGCTDVRTDTIVVNPLPSPDFTASALCIYDTAHFFYTGSGAVTNYYWNFGNGDASTAQNPTEVFTTSGNQSVSLITLTAQGCRDTITKTVLVNPLPVINVSPTVIICPFTTTQLSASGGVSYIWSPGSTLNDSVINNPIASPTATTTYHVSVTDANGCTNMDSEKVNLYPIPQINAGPDTSICLTGANYHTSVQLNATGGISYTWSPATGLSSTTIPNPIASPPANQTYYVTGIDANGCYNVDSITVFDLDPALNLIVDTAKGICDFDTTTLNVLRQGDSYYVWTPNIGISDPNSNSPNFYPHTTTTYIFTVQNYCYTKSDTAKIIVHSLPPVSTQGIDSVCIGGSDTLRASGASTYVWQPDSTLSDTTIADPIATPNSTDIYYVTGTDTFGCKKKDSVLVYVYQPPVVGIGPDTPFICEGKPIQLIAIGGVDYLWRADPTLSSLTVANPIATPADTSWYYVTIYNIHQCHADDSIHINVQLPVQATALSPFDICLGSTVQLSSAGGFYYQWIPGIWLNDSLISNPISTPDSTIIYTVKVSNDCFSATATVDVTVHQPPIINAGDDTTIYRNTSATLNGYTNGMNYYWYPGDTNNSILDPFSLTTPVTPLVTTTYYLYATSAFGCVNLDSVVVSINSLTLILLPDAFTPNDDGLNDEFRIVRYLNIELLEEFAVYDRWGEKVFSTDIITDGWNGKYKGHEEPLGVYVWMVKARTYDGEEILKKGNVTLIR
jgi:gliding motility-associated-like protein